MGRCICKEYDGEDLIDTQTPSRTVHEALARNEPDDVVLRLLDSDVEGLSLQRKTCTKYGYYVEVVGECLQNGCKDIKIGTAPGTYWSPGPGSYDGVDCFSSFSYVGSRREVKDSYWMAYPLQIALYKERSFTIISTMLNKHKQAIYRENQTYKGEYYWLPLHYAASVGASPEIMQLLISMYPQGLDVQDRQLQQGRTPRELARRAGDALPAESLSLLMKPTSDWVSSNDLVSHFEEPPLEAATPPPRHGSYMHRAVVFVSILVALTISIEIFFVLKNWRSSHSVVTDEGDESDEANESDADETDEATPVV